MSRRPRHRHASFEHSDTSAKLIGYFKLSSVQHYVVIDPQTRAVTHHRRAGGAVASAGPLSSGTLQFDPPGLNVEVADLLG